MLNFWQAQAALRPGKLFLVIFVKLMQIKVYTEISARHLHLAQKDFWKLFGPGAKLHKIRDLYLPSIFACEETVTVQIGEEKLSQVRVVGPFRAQTQIEISATDARALKAAVPLRLSGDLQGSQDCTLLGPQGRIDLSEGIIIAQRHLHIPPQEATRLHLKQHQKISIQMEGERGLTFHQIPVRIDPDAKIAFHIDTDEGNAAGISQNGEGLLMIK